MPTYYKKPKSAAEEEWIARSGADGGGQRDPYAPWKFHVPPVEKPVAKPVQQTGSVNFTPYTPRPESRLKKALKRFINVTLKVVGWLFALAVLAAIVMGR